MYVFSLVKVCLCADLIYKTSYKIVKDLLQYCFITDRKYTVLLNKKTLKTAIKILRENIIFSETKIHSAFFFL